MSKDQLIEKIHARLPLVLPRHTEEGHFYEHVLEGLDYSIVYPSVTGMLSVLKDEGLANWKMNRALDYVFANFKHFSDGTVMEHIEAAKMVPVDLFEDAGDVGTEVHSIRERYFRNWIDDGHRPTNSLIYYYSPPDGMPKDPRIISALRGIEKFLSDTGYIPIACELFLVHDKLKIGGTIDDIGLIPRLVREPQGFCDHKNKIISMEKLKINCPTCDAKWKYEMVFSDLKTSNQIKYHYFFQVMMYYTMFTRWVRIRPKRNFILRVSKENGTYEIKDIPAIHKLVPYAKNILKTNEGIEIAKGLLKKETFKI